MKFSFTTREKKSEKTKTGMLAKKARLHFVSGIILGTIFFIPLLVWAQSAVDFGLGYGSSIGLGTQDIRVTIARIIKIALGVLGIIATLIIIYGGYVWMTAAGNEQKVSTAKKILINGVIGLLIIILAYALTVWIFRVIIGGSTGGSGGPCTDGQISGCTRCVAGAWVYDFTLCPLPGADFRLKAVQTTHSGNNPAQNVYLCSRVQSNFSNRIDQLSVEEAVTNNQLRIETFSGNWQVAGNVLTFKHNDNLFASNTAYRLMLPKQGNANPLRDQSRIPLTLTLCDPAVGCTDTGAHFTWDFETGEENDTIAPFITNTYPVFEGPTYPNRNVPRTPIFEVYFSEDIDATSVAEADGTPKTNVITVERISGQGGSVDETISNEIMEVYFSSDNGFRFNLKDPNLLDSFRWYRITVQGVEDLCGNQMTEPLVWEFQTNDAAPGVRNWYPKGTNQCTDVDVIVNFGTSMFDQQVTFVITGSDSSVYSASIRPSALEPGPYQVNGDGGTLSVADPGEPYSNHFKSFVFTPTSPWNTNTTYTVTITTDLVINTSGGTLSHSWSFSTSDPASCVCAPYITSVTPNEGMAGQCVTIRGRCFTGTVSQPAELTSLTINGQNSAWGGYDKNYITTTIPDDLPVGTSAPLVATITYNNPVLGSITSNDNISFYVNQPGIYTGPCLWSINPSVGCVGTNITLNGIRFGADPGSYATEQNNVTFTPNRRAENSDFSLWNNTTIKTKVPLATVDGDVFVTAAGFTTNGVPFDMSCGAGQPCSSNELSCNPNNLSCLPNYECNETTCLCQSVGGGLGDPCSLDVNSCVPDDSQCDQSQSLICDLEDCICVDDGTSGGGGFRVSTAWPSCDGACVDSEIGAKFSSPANEETLKSNDSVLLWLCGGGDDICQIGTAQIINIFYNHDDREVYIYPSSDLQRNRRYRVILTNNILSIGGIAIQNLNFDRDSNGSNDSYSWTFTTSADSCVLTSIESSPVNMNFNGVGQNKSIFGRALSDQQCGTNKYVNPWAYDWKWNDENGGTIARVSNRDTNNDGRYDPSQIVSSTGVGNTRIMSEVDAFSAFTDVTVTSGGTGVGDDCDREPLVFGCQLNEDYCRTFGLICDPDANCTCQEPGSTPLPPGVVNVIPPNTQTDVCRNTMVQVTFNQRMDINSIEFPRSFNITNLSGPDRQVQGQLVFYTANQGVYGCNNSQGCTVARFIPSRVYAANTEFTISLTTEIKSSQGVNLSTEFNSIFTTGSQICRVNKVDLQPVYYLFTSLSENVSYVASALDSRGGLLVPLVGFYDWTWQWAKTDTDNVITINDTPQPDTKDISPQPRNGIATINATAQITSADQSIGDTVGRKIKGTAEAEVFICTYPWPLEPPMEDAQYGFQMKYCRGNNESNLYGLLSAPTSSIISLTTTDPDLLREYLFNYLPASLPPPISEEEPSFLLNKLDNYRLGRVIIDWWRKTLALFGGSSAVAQVPQDVIGLRIYANPNYLGPLAWYQQKNFPKGKPQNLTVDGFPAIRDGTSVYILGPKQDFVFQTYIYVLSYNDLSTNANKQIFDQLIKNFRFYTLTPEEKPKIARDLKRLADASFIANRVENYKNQTGSYPQLSAGSYVIGMSTTKWPSWQSTLSNQLGVSLPTDPINKFAGMCNDENEIPQTCLQNSDCANGQCIPGCPTGANPETCWNEVTQQYACPNGSAIYQYRRDNNDFKVGVLFEAINGLMAVPNYLETNSSYCNGTIYSNEGFCGDGIVQPALGEECEPGQEMMYCADNITSWHTPDYISCKTTPPWACRWFDDALPIIGECGGYCGDGILQSSFEVCDGTAGMAGLGGATCYTNCSNYYCNPGYVMINGVCELGWCDPGTQDCSSQITNGSGQYQDCNFVSGSWQWSNCQVTSCNPGYIISGNSCILAQPVVTILSPAPNAIVTSTVSVLYNINQGGVINFYRNGSYISTTGNNAGNHTHTFTGLSYGANQLLIEIVNTNGTGTIQRTVNYPAPPPPPAPTVTINNPTNNSSGGSSVTMNFTISQGGVYNVLRDGVVVYTTGDNADTYTYNYTGLTSGPHVLGVDITNANGTGQAQVNYTVNPPPPPTVTINSPNNNTTGGSSVVMNFTISQSGVYNILRDGVVVYTTGANADTYTYNFTSLTPGPHVLGVRITNANGTGQAQVNYTVNPPPPPTVTINSPNNNTTGGSSVVMNFTISQGGTYAILLNGFNVASSTVVAGNYSYTYSSLPNGTHVLGVRITNANGTGQAQVNYIASTPPPTVTITSPTNGSTGTTNSVTMSYTVSAAVSATILLDGSPISGTSHGSSGTYNFNYTNLSNGTHVLQVNVSNAYGNGSAQVNYNVSVPPIVTILNPINGSSGGSNVTLQFNINQAGTYAITLNGTEVNSATALAGTYTYNLTNLPVGPNTIAVSITNTYGSNTHQITYNRLADIPSAPSGLTAVANSNNINLNWTDNSNNETSFIIDRAVGGPTGWVLGYATVSANTTSYTDAGLADGTYYYRVKARNADGDSAYSNVANATILSSGTIFVTSASRSGDLAYYKPGPNYGYMENANVLCQDLADASSLVRPGEWRAWISGYSVTGNYLNAQQNLSGYQSSPLLNKHGTYMDLVANQISGLWTTGLMDSINYDENGNQVSANVWTGTFPDSSHSWINCSYWSSIFYNGTFGDTNYSNNFWTNNGFQGCYNSNRIYCIWYKEK